MPEGPEIRRAADQLAAAIGHGPLRHVEFHLPALARRAGDLVGRRILSIVPRGKALLTRFDHGLTLYTHNQLYGVWKVARPGERPETTRTLRVALDTDAAALLLYSASDVALLDDAALARHPFLAKLGPDVLDDTTTAVDVEARLATPAFHRRRLGALLLDQGFLAGLGNYLRSEILFDAGLQPERRPCDLDDAERRRLAEACLALPRSSYRTRGRRGGRYGTAFRFRVFGREGEPCVACGMPIERREIGTRRLYACPRCQA
ncbi:MAG: endonuclease VIII [Lysobacteraceae bacterium]|jgi:endonuclease-8|nr:endonuclease VIII [Xanthomonadaceae bacterium]MCZ8317421.1 endonuclease VIII [Silanimonas sp.]